MTTFIYALIDPVSGRIRYIGKTHEPRERLLAHLKDKKQCRRTAWIKHLANRGLIPSIEVLDEVPSDQWEFWECEYIRVFRMIGMNLVNSTDGGEGVVNSPEVREKLRLANIGKKHSDETKKKIKAITSSPARRELTRQVMLGNKRRLGWKMPAAVKMKIGNSNRGKLKGKPLSDEHRAKVSASLKGKKGRITSAETRAKLSIRLRGLGNPRFGVRLSAETRAKIGAATKLRWERKESKGNA